LSARPGQTGGNRYVIAEGVPENGCAGKGNHAGKVWESHQGMGKRKQEPGEDIKPGYLGTGAVIIPGQRKYSVKTGGHPRDNKRDFLLKLLGREEITKARRSSEGLKLLDIHRKGKQTGVGEGRGSHEKWNLSKNSNHPQPYPLGKPYMEKDTLRGSGKKRSRDNWGVGGVGMGV